MAGGPRWQQSDFSEAERKGLKFSNEVILLKPVNENDTRSNEEIKTAVIKQCDKIKSKIKVKNVKQMRHKGIVMEINSKQDTKIIDQIDLKAIGFKIESPKKYSLSIIYDVEKDLMKEELKEDLLNKNLDGNLETESAKLKEKVIFKYSFNTKGNQVNWIVQVPAIIFNKIANKGRVFMAWRSYSVKEFVNIISYI